MPKPGNAHWAQWGMLSILLQSCVCVRDHLCLVNKCLAKPLVSQPQSHVQLAVVLRIFGNSLKRSLWAPAAVTKESHCWQCPANASCWQTFLLSAKGELLSFWPRQISSLIPSVKRSFLVTFIFPHELEVLLNILFYFCLLHWPRGQAWEEWFFNRCFCHPSHIPCLNKSLQLRVTIFDSV